MNSNQNSHKHRTVINWWYNCIRLAIATTGKSPGSKDRPSVTHPIIRGTLQKHEPTKFQFAYIKQIVSTIVGNVICVYISNTTTKASKGSMTSLTT